jgi:hypothetical protein
MVFFKKLDNTLDLPDINPFNSINMIFQSRICLIIMSNRINSKPLGFCSFLKNDGELSIPGNKSYPHGSILETPDTKMLPIQS